MTHAITTLDDRELDAVCGGTGLNIGSFNWTSQRAKNVHVVVAGAAAGLASHRASRKLPLSDHSVVGPVMDDPRPPKF